MSYTTITLSTQDAELTDRIAAAIAKETFAGEGFGDTPTGERVKAGGPYTVLAEFVWPCCIDFEADYAFAVDSGNPSPGGDPGVIGDDEIGAAVQAHWPEVPGA